MRDGMRLLRNHQALPVVHLDLQSPSSDINRRPDGPVREIVLEGNACHATFDAAEDGYVWISLAPVRGWSWTLDGGPVELEQGPGIVQFLPVTKDRHEIVGRYRPPGYVAAAVTSVAALMLVVVTLLAPTFGYRRKGGVAT